MKNLSGYLKQIPNNKFKIFKLCLVNNGLEKNDIMELLKDDMELDNL